MHLRRLSSNIFPPIKTIKKVLHDRTPPTHISVKQTFKTSIATQYEIYAFYKEKNPSYKSELEKLEKSGYFISKICNEKTNCLLINIDSLDIMLELTQKTEVPYTYKKAEKTDINNISDQEFKFLCDLSNYGYVNVTKEGKIVPKRLYQGWITNPHTKPHNDEVELSTGSIKAETNQAISDLCEIIEDKRIAQEFTKLKGPLASDQVFTFGEIKNSKLTLYPNLRDDGFAFSDALATQTLDTDSFCSAFSDSDNIEEIEKNLYVALHVLANPKLADQFLSLKIEGLNFKNFNEAITLDKPDEPVEPVEPVECNVCVETPDESKTNKSPRNDITFSLNTKSGCQSKNCQNVNCQDHNPNIAQSILAQMENYQDKKHSLSKPESEEEKTKYFENCKKLLKEAIDQAIKDLNQSNSSQKIYRALFYTTIVLKKTWSAFNLSDTNSTNSCSSDKCTSDSCGTTCSPQKPVKPMHNPFIYSEKNCAEEKTTTPICKLDDISEEKFEKNKDNIIKNLKTILRNINTHDLKKHGLDKFKKKILNELDDQIENTIKHIDDANQLDIMKYAQCLRYIEVRLFHLDCFKATEIFKSEIEALNKLSKQLLDRIKDLRNDFWESIKDPANQADMLDHIDTLAIKTVLRLRKATLIQNTKTDEYDCFLKDSEGNLKGREHFLKIEQEDNINKALRYFHPHTQEPITNHPLNRPLYHFIAGQAVPITFTTGHSGAGKSTAKEGLKTDKTTLLSSNEVGPRDDDYKNNQFSITTQQKGVNLFIDFFKKNNITINKININASSKEKDQYLKGCLCCSDQDELINILEKIELGFIDTDHLLIDASGLTGKETAFVLAAYPWASTYLKNIIGIADSNQPIWKKLIKEFRKDNTKEKINFLSKIDETKEGCFEPDELLALEQLEYATLLIDNDKGSLIDNDKGSLKQYSADFIDMINCYREFKGQKPLEIQELNIKENKDALKNSTESPLTETRDSKVNRKRTQLALNQVEKHRGASEKENTKLETLEFEIKAGQEYAFIKALCNYLQENHLRRFKGKIADKLIQWDSTNIYIGNNQTPFNPEYPNDIINSLMSYTQKNQTKEVSLYSWFTQQLKQRGG